MRRSSFGLMAALALAAAATTTRSQEAFRPVEPDTGPPPTHHKPYAKQYKGQKKADYKTNTRRDAAKAYSKFQNVKRRGK